MTRIQARLIRKIRRNGFKRAAALFVQDELIRKLATLVRKFHEPPCWSN